MTDIAEPTIVQIDLGDAQQCQDLLYVFDAYVREPIIEGKPLPAEVLDQIVPGLQAHGGAVVLVAYLDGQPAGMAISFLGFSTFAARPLLNIHDFGVHPDAQGKGVGRKLMEAVCQEAARLGCCKVTLEVSPKNVAAKTLYEKCGFEDGSEFMTKRLS